MLPLNVIGARSEFQKEGSNQHVDDAQGSDLYLLSLLDAAFEKGAVNDVPDFLVVRVTVDLHIVFCVVRAKPEGYLINPKDGL